MRRHAVLTMLGLWLSCGLAAAQTTPARPAPTPAPPAPATPAATPAPQPVPFPADAHVAIVNMERVIAASRLGRAGQAALKATNDKWAATLQGLNGRVQGLQQELQTQQTTLSAAAFNAKRAEIDKTQLEIQYQQKQAQAEMDQLSAQLSDDFDGKVGPILEALRREHNLWTLIEVSQQAQPEQITVIAFHPGIDLTAEVVKRLDTLP